MYGLFALIESNQPEETQRSRLAFDIRDGRVSPPVPADMGSSGEPASEVRYARSGNARQGLDAIGSALTAYASDHDSYPSSLSDGLHELEAYNPRVSMALKAFEAERLSGYERTIAADLRSEQVKLTALPKGASDPITLELVYYARVVSSGDDYATTEDYSSSEENSSSEEYGQD
jgi:hypothetical protein